MVPLNYIINYTTIGPILIFMGIIFLIFNRKWREKVMKAAWNLAGIGLHKWVRDQ
ncbi:hypothetical protein HYT23_02015 [Candidatus Pacearchaeota archaeon]|nr:hypothetical protein [Candidatus Pacearchaeota archaeon]